MLTAIEFAHAMNVLQFHAEALGVRLRGYSTDRYQYAEILLTTTSGRSPLVIDRFTALAAGMRGRVEVEYLVNGVVMMRLRICCELPIETSAVVTDEKAIVEVRQ